MPFTPFTRFTTLAPYASLRAALSGALLLLPLVAGAQPKAPALTARPRAAQLSAAPGAELDTAQARADFDLLQRALEEAHGGYARWTTREELARRFAVHRARIDRPMSIPAFARIISEAIAEVRDGHARLEFDSVTAGALSRARLFPLRVALEGPRLVVVANFASRDTAIRPGMEVTEINGRPAAQLVASLLSTVSGDGFIETGRRARLEREFPQRLWLFADQSESFRVVATDASGRSVTATLEGVPESSRRAGANPLNYRLTDNLARLDGPSGNVALELFDEPGVARLRVRAFDGASFLSTLDGAFREIEERGITALILDLRGNGGGVDDYGARLVSHLVNEPFRYFDRIEVTTVAPSFATWLPRTYDGLRRGTRAHPDGGYRVTTTLHPGVGEQYPSRTPFRGMLVVLLDGGSFSTTADVAAQLRSRGRATFLGEESAGTYEGNTSGLNALVTLPASRLRLKVMMYGYWNAVRPPSAPGRGIIPDEILPRRVADLLAGRDPAMARALEIARDAATR